MLFQSMFELNKTIKESTMDFNGKIMVTDETMLKEQKYTNCYRTRYSMKTMTS